MFFSLAWGRDISTWGRDIERLISINLDNHPWQQESELMSEFAKNLETYCDTINPMYFKRFPSAKEACAFPELFKTYLVLTEKIKDPQVSGIIIPEVEIENSVYPILNSGAWQQLIFSDQEGISNALTLMLLRSAIEKSLISHSEWVYLQTSSELLNAFASFVIPRFIASFSAYSEILKKLVFAKHFRCPLLKNKTCQKATQEVETQINSIRQSLLESQLIEIFINSEDNKKDPSLSAIKKVIEFSNSIELAQIQIRPSEFLKNIKANKEDSVLSLLKIEYLKINPGTLNLGSMESTHILLIASILSEINQAHEYVKKYHRGSKNILNKIKISALHELLEYKSIINSFIIHKEVIK